MSERPARVYRHWPFLASTVFLLLLEVDFVVMLVSWVVRAPSYESVVESILALVPLLAFGTFLVLVWRIRTVVDDTGVSQYWIRRSYRVPRAEITAVETENGLGRWFLRVYCGERTAEIIPCIRAWSWSTGVPPRALIAVRRELTEPTPTTDTDPGFPAGS